MLYCSGKMGSHTETTARSSGWFLSRIYHNEYKIIRIPKEGQLTLGTGKNANFMFCPIKYSNVSPEHCSLQMINGKPTVTDCQSQKGTYVEYFRFDMFAPGQSVLEEGNRVGFGITPCEIPQYYKSHEDQLLYRVCREISVDEAIVVSDDEETEKEVDDVKPTVLLIKQEPLDTSADKTETTPGSSVTNHTSLCVSIPEELLQKSSFEEEYDQYLNGCHTSQGYESDTEQSSSYTNNEVIVVSDDEYTDQHYSQMVLEELKQELDDGEQILPETVEEDESALGWAYKLKPDADATISDRITCDPKPADTLSKDQKEQRKNQLLEIAEKQKHQKGQQTHAVTATSITKPKVKFTPTNRGAFLIDPIPPPSSRMPTTSRPTPTDESIICTQSTMLEQLPTFDKDEVIDMRPKKLTFQSVARVSNVDRSMPASGSGVHKVPSQSRPVAKPEAVVPQQTSSSTKTALQSQATCASKSSGEPRKEAPQKVVPPTKTDTVSSTVQPSMPKKPPCEGPLKSILKKCDGDQFRATFKKHVLFAENLNQTKVVSRYLPQITSTDTPPEPVNVQQQSLQRELDVLSEVLEWRPALLLDTITELSSTGSSGPFVAEGRMLQKVENYDTYEQFRAIHLPFLMRELWTDLKMNTRNDVSCFMLENVHIDPYNHPKLCKITCDVFVRPTGKEQFPTFDFGILEYYSSLHLLHRVFALIRHHSRGSSPSSFGTKSNKSQSMQLYHFTMFAAEREYEGLRTGTAFTFRPITRIHLNLRRCNALTMLEHSPLLPNILSPAINQSIVLEIAKMADSGTRNRIEEHLPVGSLNPGQLDVVAAVVNECCYWEKPTISIIQGPPGTGKSRVISHLVLELLKGTYPKPYDRMKVLVCASSNTAVDVIVKNLLKLQQRMAEENRFKLVRTGTRNKVDAECIPVFIDKLVQDEVTRENQHSMPLTDPSLVSTYEREKIVLEKRIKVSIAEIEKGSNVNLDHLNEMKRKYQNLEELLHPGSTSTGRKGQENAVRARILKQADIVCTTLGSCSTLGLHCSNLTFGVCVIDEATQCTELCTLLPLQYGVKKMVLVGDINQLPATVLDQQSVEAGFRTSLFSRLYQSYIGSSDEHVGLNLLKTQYRMHPEICHWPNLYFYSAQLRNASCTEMMRKQIPLQPYMVISLSYNQELTQAHHEIYNRDEIQFVVGLMKEVVKCCDKQATFAIITPYARHKEELGNSLRNFRLPQVEVHSIDSVQGKEYDVVIISLARSNGAGFLNNPERINVAITRAKQCLVLCGNFASLQHKPVWSALLKDAETRRMFFHLEEHDPAEDGHTMVKNIMERLRRKE
uniref:FHA domain-containing protein n=1 Tax=Anopheles farauti TaxID=69004 RepID=A0A182Q8H3_9DIPT